MPAIRNRLARCLAVGLALAAAWPARADPPRPVLSSDDLELIDSATWGITTSEAARFVRMGRARWLAAQLHPAPEAGLPAAVQQRIDADPSAGRPLRSLLAELEVQARTASGLTDPEAKTVAQAAYQASLNDVARASMSRTILRDLYAPAQLRERMTWFWFNRFNVHAAKANLRAMVGDYVDTAIRPHALGRFRDLLGATLRHPAMMRYLDNAESAAGKVNENYARGIMELHTTGVGAGYTQADVEALARILTGAGIDTKPDDPKLRPELQARLVRDGAFLFNPARHDGGDKVFLGRPVAGGGFEEIETALDLLARHPKTAESVSRATAAYFVGDDPPAPMVSRMAETFGRRDGDIAAVLETMFGSPDFAAARTRHLKDPMTFVLSALRLAYDETPITNTQPIQNWLNRLGQGLFNHATPDGYPAGSAAWSGPGQMTARFEVARQIGGGSAGLFKAAPDAPAGASERPAFPLLQNELYFTVLRSRLAPATRATLDQAVSPQEWNALYLASPDFMR